MQAGAHASCRVLWWGHARCQPRSRAQQRDCKEDMPGSGVWAQPRVRLPIPSDRLGGAPAHTHRPAWSAVSRMRYRLAEQVSPRGVEQRTRGALLTSRPPQSSSNPSARAAAAAYMRAHGASPVAWTACHLYGFTAVSRAHASARGCGRKGVSIGRRVGHVHLEEPARVPCSRRCRPGPARSADRRAPARGHSALQAPRLGLPATGERCHWDRIGARSCTMPSRRSVVRTTRCQRGVPARSRTNKSSVASPAGPMPPCRRGGVRRRQTQKQRHGA